MQKRALIKANKAGGWWSCWAFRLAPSWSLISVCRAPNAAPGGPQGPMRGHRECCVQSICCYKSLNFISLWTRSWPPHDSLPTTIITAQSVYAYCTLGSITPVVSLIPTYPIISFHQYTSMTKVNNDIPVSHLFKGTGLKRLLDISIADCFSACVRLWMVWLVNSPIDQWRQFASGLASACLNSRFRDDRSWRKERDSVWHYLIFQLFSFYLMLHAL